VSTLDSAATGIARERLGLMSARQWALPTVLSVGLVAWGLFLAHRAYDLDSPGAAFYRAFDRPFYTDMVTKLPAGLDHLAMLGACLAATTGLGAVLLRALRTPWNDAVERWFYAIAAGMTVGSFAAIGLGFAGLLQRPVFFGIGGVGMTCFAVEALLALRRLVATGRITVPRPSALNLFLVLLLAVFAYTALLFALTPVVQYDARWYHLAVPQHFARAGRIYDIVRITRISGAGLTPYEEMLYTGILVVSGQVTAKLLNWVLAVLTALLLVYFAREHLRSVRAGLLAGLIFLSTPVVVWAAATADNDLPLPFLTLLSMHAFLRWRTLRDRRWLALAAGCAGYSMGVKIFGLLTVALLSAAVAWVTLIERREGLGQLAGRAALMVGVTVTVSLPWLIYAYRLTGDPVFPYLDALFPTPFWTAATTTAGAGFIHSYGSDPTVRGLILLPWSLFMHGERYRGILGPLFLALAPMALLALRGRGNIVLHFVAIFTTLWTVGWFTTHLLEDRYLAAVLPLLALLVAAGIVMPDVPLPGRRLITSTALVIALLGVAVSNQLTVPATVHATDANVDGRAYADWAYLYSGKPADAVFYNPTLAWMNRYLDPRTDKVYDGVWYISGYLYSDIEMFNGAGSDGPEYLGQWKLTDNNALSLLRANHITYLLLYDKSAHDVLASPLGPHLREVHVPGENLRLFHIEPE
jgi:4-amino-4-deoxy-L-arabinose transferase-like glycosyltransferase